MRRILLIQVRDPNDPMAGHEYDCVVRRLRGLSEAQGEGVKVQTRNVLAEVADAAWLDGQHGVIVGGSGAYSVHDPRSGRWVDPLRALLESVLRRGLPGFGICFGHQLLGLHLGARVATVPDLAEIGTQSFALTEAGRLDDVTGALGDLFRGQTGHSDSVLDVPEGVDLLARSATLDTQVFRVRGTRFYTSQFHPDLNGDEARERYAAYSRALEEAGAEPPKGDPEAFHPGEDDASSLLARWLDRLEP